MEREDGGGVFSTASHSAALSSPVPCNTCLPSPSLSLATSNGLREELGQLRGLQHSIQDECEELRQKVDHVTRVSPVSACLGAISYVWSHMFRAGWCHRME